MANKEQFLDRNGVSHFYLLIKNKLTAYFKTLFVSKKAGYDLSQNDFTNELKTKLENMSASGGGSGVTDYNELLNRPVYGEGFHSFFDGNETPNPISVPILGSNAYKVSDLTPTKEQMYSADLFFNGELNGNKLSQENIVATLEKDGETGAIAFAVNESRTIMVAYTTGTLTGVVQGNPISVTVPSDGEGIYWLLNSEIANKTFEIEYGEIKKLDDMYIPNNIPRLDESGVIPTRNLPLIPAEKLPSYVDDVIEGYYCGSFYESYDKDEQGNEHWGIEITPESGKIYLDLLTNHTYRWSGSQYVKIESSAGLTALTNTEIDEIIASVDSSTE